MIQYVHFIDCIVVVRFIRGKVIVVVWRWVLMVDLRLKKMKIGIGFLDFGLE